jgi:Fic-DOC domain mobile mystery protein B
MILGDVDPADATPLTDDDVDGLIPTWVISRAELNVAEQINIERAFAWSFDRRRLRQLTGDRLLTIEFSDQLHRRMFGDVWAWAGKRRIRETNIGVEPTQIAVKMRDTFDDARYWHEHSSMPAEEIAVRIHHRLVSIHPYQNGNGRQTRLMADLYLAVRGLRVLTWGGTSLGGGDVGRRSYIAALRQADAGDVTALLDFATGA